MRRVVMEDGRLFSCQLRRCRSRDLCLKTRIGKRGDEVETEREREREVIARLRTYARRWGLRRLDHSLHNNMNSPSLSNVPFQLMKGKAKTRNSCVFYYADSCDVISLSRDSRVSSRDQYTSRDNHLSHT